MDLLVVRHAPAEDRETFARTGEPDRNRPLTPQGRTKMERNAAGLRAVVPQIDVLATSPCLRAAETAGIISAAFGDQDVEVLSQLEPGTPPTRLTPWLRRRRQAGVVCVVGHEPDLSQLVGWLVTGAAESIVTFKKGGACLVRLADPPGPTAGEVRWHLTPALLRGLA